MPCSKSASTVPAFTLPRDGGGTAGPADFPGRKLVIYFYPKDDTSGCTKEAIGFTARAPELRRRRRGGRSASPRTA